jgi:hypothetical protein
MLRRSCFVLAIIGCAVSFLALAGCKTAAKVTGTHYARFAAEPDQVVEAAKGALDELELQTLSSSATKLDGQIIAQTAQGEKVTIKVDREGEGVSGASIKVGVVGDKTISEAIIEKTQERLKK